MVNLQTFVRENLIMTDGKPTVESKAGIIALYFALTDERLKNGRKRQSEALEERNYADYLKR